MYSGFLICFSLFWQSSWSNCFATLQQSAAGTAQDKANEAGNYAGAKAQDAKSAASDASGAAKEKAGQTGNFLGDKWEQTKQATSDATGTAQDKASGAAGYTQDRAGDATNYAKETANSASQFAADKATQAKEATGSILQQVQNTFFKPRRFLNSCIRCALLRSCCSTGYGMVVKIVRAVFLMVFLLFLSPCRLEMLWPTLTNP